MNELLAALSLDSLSESPSEWATAISKERSSDETIVEVDSNSAFLLSSVLKIWMGVGKAYMMFFLRLGLSGGLFESVEVDI